MSHQGHLCSPNRELPRACALGQDTGPRPHGVLTWTHSPALSALGRIPVQRWGCEVLYRACACGRPRPCRPRLHCAATTRLGRSQRDHRRRLDFGRAQGGCSSGWSGSAGAPPPPREAGEVIVKDNNNGRDMTACCPLSALGPCSGCSLLATLPRGDGCFRSTDENTQL